MSPHQERQLCTSQSLIKLDAPPHKDWILVKLSHVNEALSELEAEIFDHEEKKGCRLFRVIQVGPFVKNESIAPGKLIIAHKSSGLYLQKASKIHGDICYLIRENQILGFLEI